MMLILIPIRILIPIPTLIPIKGPTLGHASLGLWAIHQQFMNSLWTNLDLFSRPSFWQESTKLGCNMNNMDPSPVFLSSLLSSSFPLHHFDGNLFALPSLSIQPKAFMSSLWTVYERFMNDSAKRNQRPSWATVRAPSALLCTFYPPRQHVIHTHAHMWIIFSRVVVLMVRVGPSESGTW